MSKTYIQQFLLAIAGIIVVMSLYIFGDTKIRPKMDAGSAMNSSTRGNNATAMTAEKIISLASENLSKEQKDSVALLQQLIEGSGTKEKIAANKKLGQLWARTQNMIAGAHYMELAAKLDSTKDNWREAADYYFVGMQNTGDSAARVFAGGRAFECYANAFRFDTTDTKVKVMEALSMIDGVGNVMSGVILLKEVEKVDPDNEEMNVTLGRLAIVSGQIDKAIPRLEKTIKLYPSNVEAYFHLGEAYRAKGRKQDAIKMFEKCKELEKSPSFQQQLDTYINQIKNS